MRRTPPRSRRQPPPWGTRRRISAAFEPSCGRRMCGIWPLSTPTSWSWAHQWIRARAIGRGNDMAPEIFARRRSSTRGLPENGFYYIDTEQTVLKGVRWADVGDVDVVPGSMERTARNITAAVAAIVKRGAFPGDPRRGPLGRLPCRPGARHVAAHGGAFRRAPGFVRRRRPGGPQSRRVGPAGRQAAGRHPSCRSACAASRTTPKASHAPGNWGAGSSRRNACTAKACARSSTGCPRWGTSTCLSTSMSSTPVSHQAPVRLRWGGSRSSSCTSCSLAYRRKGA